MKRIARVVALVVGLSVRAAGAGDVPPAYVAAARAHAIPAEMLYAIALAESGVTMASGAFLPWPWTLNVAGDARYYPSRVAAYRDLIDVLSHGVYNVDVGIAQVNWGWNGHRFPGAWQALDPTINLRTGAAILQEEFASTGEWLNAAGRYHAPNHRTRAQRYAARVEQHLRRLGTIE